MQAKSVGVPRKILDFHLDASCDWTAELECEHERHVRHNPPWTITPAILNGDLNPSAEKLKEMMVKSPEMTCIPNEVN